MHKQMSALQHLWISEWHDSDKSISLGILKTLCVRDVLMRLEKCKNLLNFEAMTFPEDDRALTQNCSTHRLQT
jgi:hypothetical protein